MRQLRKRHSTWLLVILILGALLLGVEYYYLFINPPQQEYNYVVPTDIPTPRPSLLPKPTIASPTKSTIPKTNSTNQSNDWNQEVEGKTTWSYIPEDDHMSTPDELFNAMNSYRQSHGIGTVQKNDTLCNIANGRALDQQANGGLDNHAGFSARAHSQTEFDTMGEVLYGGVQKQSGVHIVEWGWDRSLTGHKEAIQRSYYTHGCAGIAGYYAVFIFGAL